MECPRCKLPAACKQTIPMTGGWRRRRYVCNGGCVDDQGRTFKFTTWQDPDGGKELPYNPRAPRS